MDIRNFITFNAIVSYSSFTKAAKALSYAQSTVTLHIKELEKHYDEPLFDRIGKKIMLTEFGRELYQRTTHLEKDYQDILALRETTLPVKTIRIGGYESILKYRLYDLVKNFSRLHPNVNLSIYYGNCAELRQMVRDGALDIAFQLENETEFSQLKSISLIEEKLCLVLPPNSDLSVLHSENLAVYQTEKVCSYRKIFERYLTAQKINPQSVTETSSVDLIKQYVSYGLGFSLLPEVTVRDKSEQERLTILPFETDVSLYSQIIYHKDKHTFPAMESFIDLVKDMAETWD